MSIKTAATGSAKLDKNVQRISAEGDILLKQIALVIIGVLLVIVTFGFVYGVVTTQGAFDKQAASMSTLMSGAIFGLIGYIAGRAGRSGSEG